MESNDVDEASSATFCHPRKLQRGDYTSGFQSGVDELDDWLVKFAWVNQKANHAVTYVTATQESRVVGYYAIAMSGVSKQNVPDEVAGDSSPRDISCLLLARLAVDWQYKGKGLGAALFRDALQRAVMLSKAVGVRAFLIHARDEDARSFYMHHADLHQSPTDELHLMIPVSHVEAKLNGMFDI